MTWPSLGRMVLVELLWSLLFLSNQDAFPRLKSLLGKGEFYKNHY